MDILLVAAEAPAARDAAVLILAGASPVDRSTP
jgi:hypothetical protein